MRKLPPWARELLDRHPEAAPPTPDDPMPAWLEGDLARVPLWARIRGTHEIRQHHPFLLIEDVRSQPDLMRQVLELRSELAALAQRLIEQGIRHLVFTGCGSAFHGAQFGQFLCRQWTGWTTESHESLEFTNHWAQGHEPTALVLQSATGSSVETLDAARHATDLGVLTVALTNTAGSALEELCDENVCFPTGQRCGPDVSVLTTRLMMLYLLALEVGTATGSLDSHAADELGDAIGHLPDIAAQFLQEEDLNISQIANALKDQRALMLVGGGPNWFSAREGALKVEEESSLLCKVYRPAEYTHNAIPLLSDEVATVVIAPPGKAYARLHDAVRTARAARSPSLALVVDGDDAIAPDATFVIAVPGPLGEMLMPPLAAIACQLLGYYLGAERGYNPDALRSDDLDHARAWLTAFPFGSH
jgi:glucosamine--fructose-6-phosphate aminotransferase (isomerizing)